MQHCEVVSLLLFACSVCRVHVSNVLAESYSRADKATTLRSKFSGLELGLWSGHFQHVFAQLYVYVSRMSAEPRVIDVGISALFCAR